MFKALKMRLYLCIIIQLQFIFLTFFLKRFNEILKNLTYRILSELNTHCVTNSWEVLIHKGLSPNLTLQHLYEMLPFS